MTPPSLKITLHALHNDPDHTPQDIELSAFFAWHLGFRPAKGRPGWRTGLWERGVQDEPGYRSHWPGPLPYASRRDDCAEAEAWVVGLGLGEAYGERLFLLVHDLPGPRDEYDYYGGDTFTRLATAPPAVRCQAMLDVVREATPNLLATEGNQNRPPKGI